MDENVEYDILEDALKRCHSNWDAAQSHGLLMGRLAVARVPAGPDWMLQVLEDSDANAGNCSIFCFNRLIGSCRSACRNLHHCCLTTTT